MPGLQQLEQDLLDNGKIDSQKLETLRQHLYADGRIDRREADFLVELHKRVQRPSPAFEHFFYRAIKDHLLGDGGINRGKVQWLRETIFAEGGVDDAERKFLHELRGEAGHAGREFEALFAESMKQPPEQHTSR